MSTTVNDPKPNMEKGETVRVIGVIMADPQEKTSRKGNTMLTFPILVDDGAGHKTWWNALIMENLVLADGLGKGFFAKKRYAKFVGLGTPNKKFTKKDGTEGTSNEMLITSIELQDGTYVKPLKAEDAPF